MQLKKVIFLKSLSGNTNTAILTLNKVNNGLDITLDLYNISPQNLALGLNINNNIYKFPINSKKNQFKLQNVNNLDNNISCAVVDISNISSPKAVLSGTYNVNQQVVDCFANNNQKQEEVLYNRAKLYEYEDDAVNEQIDSIINMKDCDKNCSNCKYRQAFYEHQDKVNSLSKEEKNSKMLSNTTDNLQENFYNEIASQLDEILKNNPKENNLIAMIPNSQWAKINYFNKEGYYCIGIIKDNKEVKYIGYAMPSKIGLPPPEDINEYAQFLPIGDGENGYYVVYQDAQNGDSIKINFC